MTTLSRRIAQLTVDRKVTDAEWKSLAAQVEKLPKKASPEARQLLALWADDTFQMDDNARAGLREFLRSRGYPVPYDRNGPPAELVNELAGRNVGEPDSDFQRLSTLVGKTRSTVTVGVLLTSRPSGSARSRKRWGRCCRARRGR